MVPPGLYFLLVICLGHSQTIFLSFKILWILYHNAFPITNYFLKFTLFLEILFFFLPFHFCCQFPFQSFGFCFSLLLIVAYLPFPWVQGWQSHLSPPLRPDQYHEAPFQPGLDVVALEQAALGVNMVITCPCHWCVSTTRLCTPDFGTTHSAPKFPASLRAFWVRRYGSVGQIQLAGCRFGTLTFSTTDSALN